MWVCSWEVDVLLGCWQNQVTRHVKLQANKSTQVKNIILWGLLRGSQPFSGKLCCNHYEPHGHLELWFKLCLFCDAFCGHSSYFFFHLFLLVGGKLLYNIVVVFVIHWHESAMDLQVFPISIPPPTTLSTWILWVFPVLLTVWEDILWIRREACLFTSISSSGAL